MQIQSLLTQGRTLCDIEGVSKKRVLEILANTIAQDIPAIDADDLFRRLIARERLGSTGIGHGIAIPHCRVENYDGVIGALITLNQPIDFDSIDSEPAGDKKNFGQVILTLAPRAALGSPPRRTVWPV